MLPEFEEYTVVVSWNYKCRTREYRVGDVVALVAPDDPHKHLIKRVLGLVSLGLCGKDERQTINTESTPFIKKKEKDY